MPHRVLIYILHFPHPLLPQAWRPLKLLHNSPFFAFYNAFFTSPNLFCTPTITRVEVWGISNDGACYPQRAWCRISCLLLRGMQGTLAPPIDVYEATKSRKQSQSRLRECTEYNRVSSISNNSSNRKRPVALTSMRSTLPLQTSRLSTMLIEYLRSGVDRRGTFCTLQRTIRGPS